MFIPKSRYKLVEKHIHWLYSQKLSSIFEKFKELLQRRQMKK